ncbi:MAG: sulfite exporter TauE/SafE family protein [Cyanobacteria bacterium P01_F01_bin.143]
MTRSSLDKASLISIKLKKTLLLYRRLVFVPIALFVWSLWLTMLTPWGAIANLLENWQVALTMMFGSMVAGATSLGGGAVAFPVFTKLLEIPFQDAKVFSLAIQSVGMGAATLAICLMGIPVEWRVIRWGSLGGLLGVFLGLAFFDTLLPPNIIKISFTLVLTSFAITLMILNRGVRHCHLTIPQWGMAEKRIIFGAGMLGGIMSGLVGNGIDIIVFATIVLLFRMSEKVATPTSVILMAFNAIAGFALQVWFFNDFNPAVQSYWFAAIPVVVVGAPLGAVICDLLARETIAYILIFLILVELITSLILIPLTPTIICFSILVLAIASWLNYQMYNNKSYEL